VFPSAVFAFLLSFSIIDIVTEVWGGKTARSLIYGGFVANLLAIILIQFAIIMPPGGGWGFQDEFGLVMGSVPRITIAGMVTFVISKNLNVYIFEKIRGKTGVKHLWLRNNASSFVSQFVDTALFQAFAFLGVIPLNILIIMMVTSFCVKMVLDVLKTPLVYFGVWYCKRGS
jgi:uncharacterized integral membrane protein (TIGR00697 family)